jgi:hypothetical protein
MKTTSKCIIALTAIFLLSGVTFAQKADRQLEKKVTSKTLKSARQESKKYKKEGYYIAPGALMLDKQLENAWKTQYEQNDKGETKYIVATGNSVAESQTAAKLQATETAKLELAGQISTNIAALIENSIATQQLSNEDAASVTKTVAASKSLIAQELGRVVPLIEMYRKIGKNVEANVRLAYDTESAIETAKKVIRKSLYEETQIAHEKLEAIMNFNK